MKNLLALVIITLSSLPTLACPELTGEYQCRSGALKIQQSTQASGAVRYIIGSAYFSEVYTTDNQVRDDGDITYQAYCKNQQLKITFKYGFISTSDTYYLNEDNNLVLSTRNVIIPSSETCIRKQAN